MIRLAATEDVTIAGDSARGHAHGHHGKPKQHGKARGGADDTISGSAEPSPIAIMIKSAIDLIMSTKNVIIRDIPGMNADVIKNSLITAYKSLDIGGVSIAAADQENILVTLLQDPVYHYYYRMNTTARGGDPVDNINRCIGTTISALEKLPRTGDIFAHAIVPTFRQWSTEAWLALANGKKTHHWHAATPGYVAESFRAFDRRIKSRLYLEYVYSRGGSVDIADNNASPYSPAYTEYFASCASMLASEAILLQRKHMDNVQTYRAAPVTSTRKWIARATPLGRQYDEQGRAHRWTIYRCESGADITAAAIGKLLESGHAFTDKVIDSICSVCGVAQSAAGELSNDKIAAALAKARRMDNFFKYYEYRCPGNSQTHLHTFADGICTRCELGKLSRDAYFDKYASAWDAANVENTPVVTITAPVVAPIAEPTTETTPIVAYVFNYNVVVELADRLKVNHRLISALGAVERVEYKDVESGAFTPPEAQGRYEPRIFLLDTYVKNILMEYNQLRHFQRTIKPAYELVSLVESSGVPKHKLADLPTLMASPVEFATRYYAAFTRMHADAKPRDIVSFAMQSLCEFALQIYDDTEPTTQQLRHAFVASFMRRLFRSEELISKPGYFSWSLLYNDREDNTTLTDNRVESDEPGAYDASDEDAPMSMDAYDMENDDDEIKIKDSYVDT